MNPFALEIVERTIANTTRLLDDGVVSWSQARPGVIRIMEDLSARHPLQRPAIRRRLWSWTAERDARDGVYALRA